MDFEEYKKIDAINFSALKTLAQRSWFHMKHYLENPPPQTPQMALGSAIHAAILEPDEFEAKFVVSPVFDRRTKKGKADFEEFSKEHDGKTILSTDQAKVVDVIRSKIEKHEDATVLLKDSEKEKTIVKQINTSYGMADCKSRLDALNDKRVIDIKTTQDASETAFKAQIRRYFYHMQAGMYCEMADASEFWFIACETIEPYEIAVYKLSPYTLESGRALFFETLTKYKGCELGFENGGYETKVISI